jgi:hypothetical protein
MTDRTAGIWGDPNRLPVLRSQLGGMIGQFRTYELNYLSTAHQLMWHMGPEGKVSAMLMLGGLGLLAGAAGLPFAQDAGKAVEATYKLITNTDPNFEEHFLQFMRDDPLGFGPNAGKTFLHGVEPFGIDLGGLSFGDLISRNAQSPLDLAGAAASIFLGAPMRALQRRQSDQSDAAQFAELMPSAVKNLVKAYGVYPQEGVRTAATGQVVVPAKQISQGDQATTALGLRPAPIEDAYRERERDNRLKEGERQAARALNTRIKGLSTSAVIADQRGDRAEAQRLRAEGAAAIQSAPIGVRASFKAIRDAEAQAINPAAAAVRAAPKAVRGQVAQPVYTQP